MNEYSKYLVGEYVVNDISEGFEIDAEFDNLIEARDYANHWSDFDGKNRLIYKLEEVTS